MNLPLPLRVWSCRLLAPALLLIACPAFARDRFYIPPPPPPQKVVKDIRNFIHRVANGVKDASKQTFGAIRDRFEEDEPEPVRPRRSTTGAKGPPPSRQPSFSESRDAVPYRYDDADAFDARGPEGPPEPYDGPYPRVNIKPRDPSKSGAPAPLPPPPMDEQGPPTPADSSSRRPFLTPDQPPPTSSAPPEVPSERSSAPPPPKATPPIDESKLEYGKRVPGKRGLVYPPGSKDSPENMVDVSGFPSGQIVRDPRTGKMFRVP